MVYWLQSLYYSQVVHKGIKEKAAIKNDRKITQKVSFFKLGKFSWVLKQLHIQTCTNCIELVLINLRIG